MRTLLLAAAAALSLGVASAYAADGSEGGTAVARQWQALNGNPTIPATSYFAQKPAVQQQATAGAGVSSLFHVQDGHG